MIPVSQEKYNQLQKAAQKTEVLEKLVTAQKRYREFLGQQYSEVHSVARVHGYVTPRNEVNIGELLRERIKLLEQEVKRQ